MRLILLLSLLLGCTESLEKSDDTAGEDLDTGAPDSGSDTDIVDTDTGPTETGDTDSVDTAETATPVCEGTLVFSVSAESPTRIDPELPKVFVTSAHAMGGDVLVDKVEMAVTGPAEWLATLPSLSSGVQYVDPNGFSMFHSFGPSYAEGPIYDEANGRVVWTVTELLRLTSSDPVEAEPLSVLEGETFVFTLYIDSAHNVTGVTPEVLDGNCQEGVLGEPISW